MVHWAHTRHGSLGEAVTGQLCNKHWGIRAWEKREVSVGHAHGEEVCLHCLLPDIWFTSELYIDSVKAFIRRDSGEVDQTQHQIHPRKCRITWAAELKCSSVKKRSRWSFFSPPSSDTVWVVCCQWECDPAAQTLSWTSIHLLSLQLLTSQCCRLRRHLSPARRTNPGKAIIIITLMSLIVNTFYW